MHSAQYLWITSYYARREAGRKGDAGWRPFAYFAVLVAGGIALFVPGPWLASRLFHYDFGASFLIFTALVNIHHFILDGAIWKLRDNRMAGVVVEFAQSDCPRPTADAGEPAGQQVALAGRELPILPGRCASAARLSSCWPGEALTRHTITWPCIRRTWLICNVRRR